MQYIIIGLIILCIFLLYRYLRLRNGLHSLYQQLHYQNLTGSKFRNYMDGTDPELRLLYEEIQHVRDLQEKKQVREQQKDQNFKALITNISHDIRTPLTSISGYLQLMETMQISSKQRQYMMIMQERCTYLKELLEELFLYTKITNEGIVYQMDYMKPCTILSHTLLAFHQEFVKQKISVEVQYEAEDEVIYSDAYSLEHIFTNLLNNCLRHGQHTCVLLQWIHQDKMVIQIINDVPEAMNKDQVDQLFERFYTRDETRTTGNGLGLAIVKVLIEQLHGTVSVAYEEGNLFMTLQFPLR